MKIDNNNIAGADGVRTPATEAQQRGRTPPAGEDKARVEDSVETSGVAAKALEDSAKVERLREAVRSGTYSVDAKEVAASIVREHLERSQS
jgi:flagellar biosynthesis anti-sigma factor FlgM